MVRVVLPVQQPDDLWHAGTFTRQDGEGDLFWKGIWMIRQEDGGGFPNKDLDQTWTSFFIKKMSVINVNMRCFILYNLLTMNKHSVSFVFVTYFT